MNRHPDFPNIIQPRTGVRNGVHATSKQTTVGIDHKLSQLSYQPNYPGASEVVDFRYQ